MAELSPRERLINAQNFINAKIGQNLDLTEGIKALAESSGGFFKIPPIFRRCIIEPYYVSSDRIHSEYASGAGYEGFSLIIPDLEVNEEYTISFDLVCDRNLTGGSSSDGMAIQPFYKNLNGASGGTYNIEDYSIRKMWGNDDISTTPKTIEFTFTAPSEFCELLFGIGYVCCAFDIYNFRVNKTVNTTSELGVATLGDMVLGS